MVTFNRMQEAHDLIDECEHDPDQIVAKLSTRQRVTIARMKIYPLFNGSKIHNLYFGIISQAITDATQAGKLGLEARRYLSKEMIHAEVCGVDSEYVRTILTKMWIA